MWLAVCGRAYIYSGPVLADSFLVTYLFGILTVPRDCHSCMSTKLLDQSMREIEVSTPLFSALDQPA